MSASVLTLFTETTLDGFPLWVVLLICGGVFLAGFMDAIAGGGGIITVPTYLIAFSRLYLYVHFPSDVLGGAVLGVGIGLLMLYVERWIAGRCKHRPLQ